MNTPKILRAQIPDQGATTRVRFTSDEKPLTAELVTEGFMKGLWRVSNGGHCSWLELIMEADDGLEDPDAAWEPRRWPKEKAPPADVQHVRVGGLRWTRVWWCDRWKSGPHRRSWLQLRAIGEVVECD